MSFIDNDANDNDDNNKVHISDDNGRDEYIFINNHNDDDEGHDDDDEDHDDKI